MLPHDMLAAIPAAAPPGAADLGGAPDGGKEDCFTCICVREEASLHGDRLR